jgi:hypothetical protein
VTDPQPDPFASAPSPFEPNTPSFDMPATLPPEPTSSTRWNLPSTRRLSTVRQQLGDLFRWTTRQLWSPTGALLVGLAFIGSSTYALAGTSWFSLIRRSVWRIWRDPACRDFRGGDGSLAVNQDACLADIIAPVRTSLINSIILLIITCIVIVIMLRVAALVGSEQSVRLGEIFRPSKLLHTAWTSVVLFIATLLGLTLCILPGLVLFTAWYLAPISAAGAGNTGPWRSSWRSLRHSPIVHLLSLTITILAVVIPLALFGPLGMLTLPIAALMAARVCHQAATA